MLSSAEYGAFSTLQQVILNVSFLDRHDGSSFCRLRERRSSGAKREKLGGEKSDSCMSRD